MAGLSFYGEKMSENRKNRPRGCVVLGYKRYETRPRFDKMLDSTHKLFIIVSFREISGKFLGRSGFSLRLEFRVKCIATISSKAGASSVHGSCSIDSVRLNVENLGVVERD